MNAGGWWRKVRSKVASWFEDAPPEPEEKSEAAPATPVNPYKEGADRIRSTATWLIGALAAVATVMLAGTQLSTIGELSFDDDWWRLVMAAGAAIVAVAAVAFAIYRLTFVQAPVDIGLEYVSTQAADPDAKLTRMAAADLGLRANYPDLATFLSVYDRLRITEYQAEAALRKAKNRAASPELDEQAKAAADAAVKEKQSEVDTAHERVVALRPQMVNVFQLAGYLAIRSRFDDERIKVMVAALVAALAIVCFAWAANPPEDEAEAAAGDAVPQNPTLATLTLTEAGQERLTPTLGESCAATALKDGIGVIALSASDGIYEVVVVPEGSCTKPVTFTVGEDDGAVSAVDDVSVG